MDERLQEYPSQTDLRQAGLEGRVAYRVRTIPPVEARLDVTIVNVSWVGEWRK